MQQAPAISRSSFGRTLGVAGWLLGAVALAEIIAGSAALVSRSHHPAAGDAGSAARPAPSFGDPFASITNSTPIPAPPLLKPVPVAIAATPAPALAKGTPAPAKGAAPAASATPAIAALPRPTPVPEKAILMPESRVDGLIKEARLLRARGDTSTSVTRLREALAISPRNVVAMAELASTYEKMGLRDKEDEQWRAIYDMGDTAGVYYELADAKLKMTDTPAPAAAQATPAPNTGATTSDGFQVGASLALVNLSTVEKPETPEGYKRFTLKIPVKRRPNGKVNVSDVVIQVFFYDQLGNEEIAQTNANVSSHWATLPADWQQEDIEILEVDYTQAAAGPGKIEEGRHYYGYVVRVYYAGDLQDQAADPPSLLKKYPPPLKLQEKGE